MRIFFTVPSSALLFVIELLVSYGARAIFLVGGSRQCVRGGGVLFQRAARQVRAGHGRDCAWASASHRWSGSPGPGPTCAWARPVVLRDDGGAALVLAAETATAERLAELRALGPVDLALTGGGRRR